VRLHVTDPDILDEFEKTLKEMDEKLECIKEFSGVRCAWIGK
jgi:hypothetical protein